MRSHDADPLNDPFAILEHRVAESRVQTGSNLGATVLPECLDTVIEQPTDS